MFAIMLILYNCLIHTKYDYRCKETLKNHGIQTDYNSFLPDVNFQLPKLKGSDILEHFYKIGEELSKPYRDLTESLITSAIPPMPKVCILLVHILNINNFFSIMLNFLEVGI